MVDALGQLRENHVQVLTVGQYLRPTERHLPIVRYWHPDEFQALETRRLRARLRPRRRRPAGALSYHADQHIVQSEPGVGPLQESAA